MFTEQRESSGKKNSGKVIVGYDLGKTVSQISFCRPDGSLAETVSCVAGTEQYNIPTLLCKKKGLNQWLYGKEAQKCAEQGDGILVEDLLMLAERDEDVMVENERFHPVALLTLFVKRSLSLLNMHISLNRIEAFMFTVEELSPRMVDVLDRITIGLQLKTRKVFFQSYVESFYHYMLYQPKELWKNKVLVFDYSSGLKSLCLACNKRTTPQVVFIAEKEYPEMQRFFFPEEENERERRKRELDEKFLEIAKAEVSDGIVSTIYLLGDGFKENWALNSLKVLCRNRRVFQGNNLYSKGACYGGTERLAPSEEGKAHVYLGRDKLKSNVGMKVLKQGEEAYLAILDAGTNWYEAYAEFEIILENGNTLDLLITPLTGEDVIDKPVVLEGLPERPDRTTRLKITIEMSAVDRLVVTIEDLGFGEMFQSSGKGFSQTISL